MGYIEYLGIRYKRSADFEIIGFAAMAEGLK
jgi:hypothetical protein